jgi:transketolase
MRSDLKRILPKFLRSFPKSVIISADHGHDILSDIINTSEFKYLNVGVAEQNMFNVAAGFAREGFLPVCYFLGSLGLTRGFDQIRTQIAYPGLPCLLLCDGVGFTYGTQGISHHGLDDFGLATILPNFVVSSPYDSKIMYEELEIFTNNPRPTLMRISKDYPACSEDIMSRRLVLQEGVDFFHDSKNNEGNLIITQSSIARELLSFLPSSTFSSDLIVVYNTRGSFIELDSAVYAKRYKRIWIIDEQYCLSALTGVIHPRSFQRFQHAHIEALCVPQDSTGRSESGSRRFYIDKFGLLNFLNAPLKVSVM